MPFELISAGVPFRNQARIGRRVIAHVIDLVLMPLTLILGWVAIVWLLNGTGQTSSDARAHSYRHAESPKLCADGHSGTAQVRRPGIALSGCVPDVVDGARIVRTLSVAVPKPVRINSNLFGVEAVVVGDIA